MRINIEAYDNCKKRLVETAESPLVVGDHSSAVSKVSAAASARVCWASALALVITAALGQSACNQGNGTAISTSITPRGFKASPTASEQSSHPPDLCGTANIVELSVPLSGTGLICGPGKHEADEHIFCRPIPVKVPTQLEVTAPASGLTATLQMRQASGLGGKRGHAVCRYSSPHRKQPRDNVLELETCNLSLKAADVFVADEFTLTVDGGGDRTEAVTVRVRLTDGTTPNDRATRVFLGSTPRLDGVQLEVDAAAFPAFAGLGVKEGPPLEPGRFIESIPGGRLVVGPSVEISGASEFPSGAVRLTVPYDAALVSRLPAGTLDTLRLIQVKQVLGPSNRLDEDDVVGTQNVDFDANTVQAGLSVPGAYYPAVAEMTPTVNNGGPIMTNGANVYLIWVGDFDVNHSSDPRSAIRTFVSSLDSTDYFKILTTYGLTNPHVTIKGEAALTDITTLENDKKSGVSDAVARAISDKQWAPDPDGIFLVFGAPGVKESSNSGTFCNSYCGWHTWTPNASDHRKYAFVGHPDTCGGWGWGPSPHGNSIDFMISCASHEIAETLTDPEISAWHGIDQAGQYAGAEVGDKCGNHFPGSSRSGTPSTLANFQAGGDRFLVQSLWVNSEGGYCAMAIEQLAIEVVDKPADGLAVNQIGHFKVRVTNQSAAKLDAGTLFVTGRASGLLSGDPVPTPVPGSIDSGQSVDIDVSVQAPYEIVGNVEDVEVTFRVTEPGNNGHAFPARAMTTIQVRRAPVLVDQATCAGVAMPDLVLPNSWFDVSMTFHNTGQTIWLAGQYGATSSPLEFLKQTRGLPASLSHDVPPGSDFTVIFSAYAPAVTLPDSLDVGVQMTNGASAFLTGCSVAVPITCPGPAGESCGNCGGISDCNGSCTIPTPDNLGASCGSCRGTIDCNGSCTVATPSNFGSPCECGGTILCDGTCSVASCDLVATFENIDDDAYIWQSVQDFQSNTADAFCQINQGAVPRSGTCDVTPWMEGSSARDFIVKIGNGGCANSHGDIHFLVNGAEQLHLHKADTGFFTHCGWTYRAVVHVDLIGGTVTLVDENFCELVSDCAY